MASRTEENTSSPLPPSPGDAFQGFLKSGELRLQYCAECTKFVFYPRTLCPACGATGLEWRPVSGRAVVYSTTTVRQRPERGGDYNVSIVELEEGPRMMSAVRDIAPGEVRIGLAVVPVLAEEDGIIKVYFRPTKTSARSPAAVSTAQGPAP